MKIYFLILLLFTSNAFAQIKGVTAKSYIVMDSSGTVIIEHDAQSLRPIASITKLLVAEQINKEINPYSIVGVKTEDLVTRYTRIKNNTLVNEEQLMELALIPSNNQAIYALSRVHSTDKIIAQVNQTAIDRGLTSISIEEPSGLSANNKATAEDLAKFVNHINTSEIAKISTREFTTYGKYHSTNPYIGKLGWKFQLSKTGFTNPAGGCLVTIVEIGNKPLTVVILNSANPHTRWIDLAKIRAYISANDLFWVQTAKVIHHRKKK